MGGAQGASRGEGRRQTGLAARLGSTRSRASKRRWVSQAEVDAKRGFQKAVGVAGRGRRVVVAAERWYSSRGEGCRGAGLAGWLGLPGGGCRRKAGGAERLSSPQGWARWVSLSFGALFPSRMVPGDAEVGWFRLRVPPSGFLLFCQFKRFSLSSLFSFFFH